MKRVHSDSFDDHLSIGSKLRKLKSKLFSVLGKNDDIHIEKASSVNNNELDEKRESTPINASFFNNSQGPITARQLQEYYKSLQLENSMLTENLNNTNEKAVKDMSGEWKNAESTNIDLSDNQKDSKSNEIIVLDDEENDDVDIKDSKYEIELPESLESLPYFHQPDPLERANLIQLKRMMELEKYRRYRLNYLREHTRHLNKKGVESNKQSKVTKTYKLPKPTDVPSDRRNKSGIFNLSMLDEVPDNVETDEVKPIDNNPVKKLKFTDTKSEAANFDISDKPRSFKPAPVLTKNEKTSESKKNDIVPKTSQQATKVEKSTISVDEKPSVGFSFGSLKNKDTKLMKHSLETVVDADALNDPSMEVKKPFSFAPSAPSTALPTSTEKESNATSMFGQNTASASLFAPKNATSATDGAGASLFETAMKEKSKEDKPAFSFGKPVEKDSISVPKFSFGKSTDTEKKSESEKPSFSFEKPLESNAKRSHDDISTDAPKAFNFGAPAKSEELSVSKPTSTTTSLFGKKDESKPSESNGTKAFSFGNVAAPKTAETPKFSFGKAATPETLSLENKATIESDSKKDNNSNFAFSALKSDDKPSTSFSFGKSAVPSDDKSQKPAFNFSFNKPDTVDEGKATKPTLTTLGTNTPVLSATNASEPAKFNFATKTDNKDPAGSTQPNESTKPAFSFGENKLPGFGSTASSVTTPGASLSPAPVQNTIPAIGFSSATSTNPIVPQTAFNTSGGEVKKDAPKFNFGLNNSLNKPSESNGTAAETKANETTTVGNMFSFNSNAFPSLDEAKQKALSINQNQSAPAFKFGENANKPSAPVSSGFGAGFGNANNSFNGSVNNNTSFSFGNNNSSSGFGASNSQAVGFGGNANNNTGFGGNNAGFGAGNTGFGGSNTGFGGNNTAFGGNNTGFGSTNGGFGGSSAGMNANGINNMNANTNNGLNANNGFTVNNNNSGFSFGGSGPSSGVNSRASTPNFNFTGSQGQNVDPSAVFGAANANNDVQNTGPGKRRIAYPRRRR